MSSVNRNERFTIHSAIGLLNEVNKRLPQVTAGYALDAVQKTTIEVLLAATEFADSEVRNLNLIRRGHQARNLERDALKTLCDILYIKESRPVNRQFSELDALRTLFLPKNAKPNPTRHEFIDLTYVNSRWREVLKFYPRFWTRLDCKTKHNTDVSIRNARNSPLEIVIISTFYDTDALNLALQYIGRISSITFEQSGRLPRFLRECSSKLSSLHTLRLSYFSLRVSDLLGLFYGALRLQNIELRSLDVEFNVGIKTGVSLQSLKKLTIRPKQANDSLILLNYLDISSPASIYLEDLDFHEGLSFPPFTVKRSSHFTSVYLKFEHNHIQILLKGSCGRLHAEGRDMRLNGKRHPEKDRIRQFLDRFDLASVQELGVTVAELTTVGLLDILRPMKGLTTLFLNHCENIPLASILSTVVRDGMCRNLVLYMKTRDTITLGDVSEMAGYRKKLDSILLLTGHGILDRDHVFQYSRYISPNRKILQVPDTDKPRWDAIPRDSQ